MNDTIFITNSDVNRRESVSAAELNGPAEQANVLLPLEVHEGEPDHTTWLDHVMDDPVLPDDRNEAPTMYGFSKICLPNIRID